MKHNKTVKFFYINFLSKILKSIMHFKLLLELRFLNIKKFYFLKIIIKFLFMIKKKKAKILIDL